MKRCKICETDSLKAYAIVNGFEIWKCRACGFGQTAVTSQDIDQFYNKEYFDGSKARFSQSAEEEISPAKRWWVDRYISADRRDVLEIGPGPAAMIGRYILNSRRNASYEAVEISEFACNALRGAGFRVHEGAIYASQIRSQCRGRFDAVVATEVVEHDPDPRHFAVGMFEALRPGGIACLTTGNFDGVMARIKGAGWYYLDPPAHPVYYTPDAITLLLRGVGFSDVTVDCIGSNYIDLHLRYPFPGLLKFIHLLQLPTGMTVVARR